MSDNVERIGVEVDGGQAKAAFDSIAWHASQTDRAVNQLGASIGGLQRNLNSLGAVGRTAAQGLQATGAAGNQAAQGVNNAGGAAQRATSQFNLLQQSLFGVRGKAAFVWDLAIDGFKTAIGFAKSFIDQTSAVQRTMSLLATIKNGPGADEEFSYLTRVANNYGLSLRAIQDDYAKMNLAAQNTAMTQESLRKVFEQVSMATRTLHLNQQQTQLTFLAVEQMLSKGKLSMEELRKQFAERIPGAMQALARELGVTFPVLDKFITKIGASSEKVIPELGNAIQRLYQDAIPLAARALDAERNRIETSIGVFFKNVVESGGTEGMANLLRTINGLLQTDTVAQTFARAMNLITNSVADFLSTLKTEDIEKFANSVLDFLSSFAQLAITAGKAVIFLGQNLPMVAAAVGAFMGATAGAPLGPWGAAIGMLSGGIGGFALGKSVQGSASGQSELDQLMGNYQSIGKKIEFFEQKIADVESGKKATGGSITDWRNRLADARLERDALWAKIEPMAARATLNQSPSEIEMPNLPELRELETDPQKAMARLMKNYGLNDGSKSKEQQAAERLAERQLYFVQSLEQKLSSMIDPEEEKFDQYLLQAEKLKIGDSSPLMKRIREAVDGLQQFYNKKKQDESDRKTQNTERAFENMAGAALTDIEKFKERYDIENLRQVNDSDWATKARKMGSQLDAVLVEQKKKWDQFARDNPLFNFGFDKEQRLAELREIGDAYIAEFRRIEEERRTIQGGTKEWLAEYNENATNYGKITKDYLTFVTQTAEDMLFKLLKTGEFSFRELASYIVDYMLKVSIAQAMTPVMNQAAGWLSTAIGAVIGAYTGGAGGGVPPNPYALPARANGGAVWPGQSFLVGERGTEVFTPSSAGYITPNESISSSGGDVYVEVNIDSNGNVSTDAGQYADLGRRIGSVVRTIIVDEKRPGGLLA